MAFIGYLTQANDHLNDRPFTGARIETDRSAGAIRQPGKDKRGHSVILVIDRKKDPGRDQVHFIPLSKTKETNVLFEGFRNMRYAEDFECWALS
jgi:hypothetical protein